MAGYDDDRGMVDSASADLQNAAHAAKSAAKAAKTVSAAAAKAASGNVAGAALDILKDEETRKKVAIVLFVLIGFNLLLLCTAFLMPLAIYEGVQAYFSELGERWDQVYYAGDSGRVAAALKATISGITGILDDIGDLWTKITSSSADNDKDSRDFDQYDSADLTLIGDKQSMAEVMLRKILAVNDKLAARSKMIEDEIKSSASSGSINSYFYNQYLSDKTEYEGDDVYEVQYGGVQLTITSQYGGTSKRIQAGEAMKLMDLYTTQSGGSLDDIKLSGLMKWLGYYDEFDSDPVTFTVGDAVDLTVKGWKGEFMPQYLIEEQKVNEDKDYSSYMCAATDLLLKVSSSDFSAIQPIVDDTETTTVETQVLVTPPPTPTPTATPRPSGRPNPHRPTVTPEPEPEPTPYYETVTEVKKIVKLYYPVTVSVSVRRTNSLIDLAGLWEGSIYESKENLPNSSLSSSSSSHSSSQSSGQSGQSANVVVVGDGGEEKLT